MALSGHYSSLADSSHRRLLAPDLPTVSPALLWLARVSMLLLYSGDSVLLWYSGLVISDEAVQSGCVEAWRHHRERYRSNRCWRRKNRVCAVSGQDFHRPSATNESFLVSCCHSNHSIVDGLVQSEVLLVRRRWVDICECRALLKALARGACRVLERQVASHMVVWIHLWECNAEEKTARCYFPRGHLLQVSYWFDIQLRS